MKEERKPSRLDLGVEDIKAAERQGLSIEQIGGDVSRRDAYTYNVNELLNITINLKYTARQGGDVFAKGVKGMLKPYQTLRFFDMQTDFPNEWDAFLYSDSNELLLPFRRELIPNMGSSKISGIFTKYDLDRPGAVSMTLNNQEDLTLKDGKYLVTNGLSISSQGSELVFTIKGDKTNLRNINLVLGYKATVT